MRHALAILAAVAVLLLGAVICWADEQQEARLAAMRARRQMRMSRQIIDLTAEYRQSRDARLEVVIQVLTLQFARDYPDTPIGRFLRVGTRP
jgi:hypothetical protein